MHDLYSPALEGTVITRMSLYYPCIMPIAGREEEMASQITITCCCCKKKVQIGENPFEMLPDLAGWVSVDRKPLCRDCLALFTEEDWDWCAQPPVALRLSEIAGLMPAEVEPI